MANRSSDLQWCLFGRIGLDADRRYEVELRLQPLDVLLTLNDQVLDELPRAVGTAQAFHLESWARHPLNLTGREVRVQIRRTRRLRIFMAA